LEAPSQFKITADHQQDSFWANAVVI